MVVSGRSDREAGYRAFAMQESKGLEVGDVDAKPMGNRLLVPDDPKREIPKVDPFAASARRAAHIAKILTGAEPPTCPWSRHPSELVINLEGTANGAIDCRRGV
jgi:hypothetical protein